MTKVYLIGENLLTVQSLRGILINKGYETHAGNIFEAFETSAIIETNPDILFWESDIIESAESLVFKFLKHPEISCKSIFVLSSKTIPVLGYGLVQGIEGFVHKAGGIGDLEDCLISLCRGESYISPLLSGSFESTNGISSKKEKLVNAVLTEQEEKILVMVKKKKTSRQIADELYISHKTVQNHRHNMCRKLGLRGRNKLAEFANMYLG